MPKESVPQTPRKEKRFGWWTEGIRLCLPPKLLRYMPRTDAGVKRTQRCRAARCDTLRLLAAMCRHRTGDVWWLRFVRFCDTFSLRVPWAGDLDRPLAVRRETAARPDGFRSAQIRLNPEAPLQGELAPQATEGSTAKNVREFAEFPDSTLITYYLSQCLHTSSPFSASSTIVLPAARSPLRISRAMSVSALLWR